MGTLTPYGPRVSVRAGSFLDNDVFSVERAAATGWFDTFLTPTHRAVPMVAVVGPSGAGKTVLASQILFHAVQRGERGLLLTAYAEDHTKLLAHLRPLAFFNEPAVGDTVTLLSLPSLLGMNIDTATSAITTTMRASGARLVVVDGFQGIADQLIDSMALRRLLAAVATQLTYLDVTLVLTLTGTVREEPTTSGLTSADVVLGLHYGLDGIQHTRRIEVLKQRGRAHLPGTHSLVHVKESAMRRKLWIISLVLVVTFGTLTACGGNGDDEDEDEDDEGRRRAPQVALVHP